MKEKKEVLKKNKKVPLSKQLKKTPPPEEILEKDVLDKKPLPLYIANRIIPTLKPVIIDEQDKLDDNIKKNSKPDDTCN